MSSATLEVLKVKKNPRWKTVQFVVKVTNTGDAAWVQEGEMADKGVVNLRPKAGIVANGCGTLPALAPGESCEVTLKLSKESIPVTIGVVEEQVAWLAKVELD